MEPAHFSNEQTEFTHEQNGTPDAFHQSYEGAVETIRTEVGQSHSLVIGGDTVDT